MTHPQQQSGEIGDADAVVVVTADSLFHADALVAVLADHEIDALAAPDIQYGAGIHPSSATRPVAVLVQRNDLERAREALRQNVVDAEAMKWDEADDESGIGASAGLPQRRARMPIIGRLGFIAAIILIGILIIGVALMFW